MADLVALLAGFALGALAVVAVLGARRGAPPVVAPGRPAPPRHHAAPAPQPAPPPARSSTSPPRPSAPPPRPAGPAAPPAAAPTGAAAGAGPVRGWLEVEGEGRTVDLGEDPVTVGRGSDQVLRVRDSRASRAHAVVRRRSKGRPGWEVADSGSANGTTLNGHRIPEGRVAPLRDGDRISVGGATLVYREAAGGGDGAPAGPDATQVLG